MGKFYVAGADNTKGYCRVRQRDPSDFKKGSLRTITVKGKHRGIIKAVVGRLPGHDTTTVQSLLFSKKFYTCAPPKKIPRGDYEPKRWEDFKYDQMKKRGQV